MKTIIITSMAAILLTAVFVAFVFGLIAGLDEFARIPFYDALPVAAAVLSISVVVVIARKQRAVNALDWLRSHVRLVDRIFRPGLAQYVADLLQPAKLSVANSRVPFRTSPAPSAQEIGSAWAKVHSIASGFSPMLISLPNVINARENDHESTQDSR